MAPTSHLVTLARSITAHAEVIDAYCTEHKVPQPSFDIDGPSTVQFPAATAPEVAAAHAAVIAETRELNQLVSGPTGMLMGTSVEDVLSLHVIYHFSLASTFPVGTRTTFEAISAASGLNVIDTRRVLRHAMTNHIFREPSTGVVEHTAASRLLVENAFVRDFVGILCEEKFKGAAFTVDALSQWNGAQAPNQTGFSLGHKTSKGLYDELQSHPERGRRWAGAMSQFASRIPIDSVAEGFDWRSLPAESTVVDVGGGHGPVSIALAGILPQLTFVVQDLPSALQPRPSLDHLPPEVARRISYQEYDFTTTAQPVVGAAVYFFRAVFHNWPDADVVRILRAQRDALRGNSKILINETLLHEPGSLPAGFERRRRAMDLSMLVYFGSRERNEQDWVTILAEADKRFRLSSVTKAKPGSNQMIVIEWDGDGSH